jgi:hypothetical protein
MFNDPLIDGHFNQADFESEIQLEADSALPPLCVCDYPDRSAMSMKDYEEADGHFNQAGGYCCPHHGNTCGHCHHHDL